MPDDFLPTFTAIPNKQIPEDQCVLLKDGKPIYAGPIRRCPKPAGGSVMYLNPTDHKRIDGHMKKHQH